jgi:hypothetical protein
MTTPTGFRPVALGLLVVLLLGSCSSAAAPSSSPPPADASPSAAPTDGRGSTGGGAPGNPGLPDPTAPIGGIVHPTPVEPGFGRPKLVIPRPGQLNPRPVGAASLESAVNGRHVIVKVTWWSGVEPCNVLDSVKVERSGTTITIQLIEGTGDARAICIEIAELKATIVDLGEFEPGTYTISAAGKGDATPVMIIVS